jgi:drug/metabolite transporter (DMT)-like permease
MKTEQYGTLVAFVGTIFTGINLTLAKVGVQTIPPLIFAALSITIGGLILTVISIHKRRYFDMAFIIRKYPLRILWISIVGTSVPFFLTFFAFSLAPLTNSFLLQTELLYTILLGYVILREKITVSQALLSFTAVIGVVLILTNGQFQSVGMGDLILTVAPLSYPAAHVVAKPMLKRYDPLSIANLRILIGGCVLLVGCLIITPAQLSSLVKSNNLVLVAAESLAVMMSNTLFYFSIKRINLSKAAAINQSFPVVSVPLGVLLLGESVTPFLLVGGLMMMASILCLARIRSEIRS